MGMETKRLLWKKMEEGLKEMGMGGEEIKGKKGKEGKIK